MIKEELFKEAFGRSFGNDQPPRLGFTPGPDLAVGTKHPAVIATPSTHQGFHGLQGQPQQLGGTFGQGGRLEPNSGRTFGAQSADASTLPMVTANNAAGFGGQSDFGYQQPMGQLSQSYIQTAQPNYQGGYSAGGYSGGGFGCFIPCQPCQPCGQPYGQQPVSSAPAPSDEVLYEYYPFERTYTDYEMRERVQTVPVEKEVTEYQVVKKKVRRPVERTVQDYYLVETVTDFKVEYQKEERQQFVEKKVESKRTDYVPVESRNVIYPEGVSRQYIDRLLSSGVKPISEEEVARLKAAQPPLPQQHAFTPPKPPLAQPSLSGSGSGGRGISGNTFVGAMQNMSPTSPIAWTGSLTASRTMQGSRIEVNGASTKFDFSGANQYSVVFEHKASGQLLEIAEGKRVESQPATLGKPGVAECQRWRLKKVGQFYEIQNVQSKQVLDWRNGGGSNLLVQTVAVGGDTQQWRIEGEEGESGLLLSRDRRLAVGVQDGRVQLQQLGRGKAQTWVFHGMRVRAH